MLLEGIDPAFVASLPDLPLGSPLDRLFLVLFRLNQVGSLRDGTVPLQVWLRNAAQVTKDDFFTDVLAELSSGTLATAPRLPPPPVSAGNTPAAELRALLAEMARLAAAGQPADHLLPRLLTLKREQRARPDFAPHAQLSSGRFELLDEVGRGGVGAVWKAIDHLRGEIVAVKILHEHHGSDVLLRFRRGARYMSKLNHPHVVRVIQADGVEEPAPGPRWFFVMEYLPGGNLRQGVLARLWTPEEALRRVIEAGSGLHHAHKRGIVHRDVSPDNILIGAGGAAQLSDFDLVRAPDTTGMTGTGQAFGKYLYVAPELLDGAEEADARADVYALGMTALFAIHGRELPASVVRALDRFLDRLDCSEPVRDVLSQATAWAREDRYENAGEMCGELYLALRASAPRPSVASAEGTAVEPPAEALSACRVFFTGFDRDTYSQVGWTAEEVEGIAGDLERRLKLLGLVKGHLVVPASHLLESELARELILAHPSLLSSRILVPALHAGVPSCEAFLDEKLADPDVEESKLYVGPEQREMARLIDREARVERWDADGVSAWYKARILADIDDDRSLLRSALRAGGFALPADFRARVADTATLSRNAVYRAAKDPGSPRCWGFLCTYADFVDYLSGARAVHSEGVLPQENLVDFSKFEMLGRATRLSELEVFFKHFVDVVKAATSMHVPADLLDGVTVDDVVELHAFAVSTRFVEAYDRIQTMTKKGLTLKDPEGLVLLMEELDAFERDLHRNMEAEVQRDLRLRRRARRAGSEARSAHALASLLVPYHEAGSPHDVVMSDIRLTPVDRIAGTIGQRIRDGLDTCQALVDRRDLPERPVLLPFLEKLRRRYAEKLIG